MEKKLGFLCYVKSPKGGIDDDKVSITLHLQWWRWSIWSLLGHWRQHRAVRRGRRLRRLRLFGQNETTEERTRRDSGKCAKRRQNALSFKKLKSYLLGVGAAAQNFDYIIKKLQKCASEANCATVILCYCDFTLKYSKNPLFENAS